jgi:hypothetical protein
VSLVRLLATDDDGWQVWIGLEEDYEPPEGYSFIIGRGATASAALADATADLRQRLSDLQLLQFMREVP